MLLFTVHYKVMIRFRVQFTSPVAGIGFFYQDFFSSKLTKFGCTLGA